MITFEEIWKIREALYKNNSVIVSISCQTEVSDVSFSQSTPLALTNAKNSDISILETVIINKNNQYFKANFPTYNGVCQTFLFPCYSTKYLSIKINGEEILNENQKI